MKRRLKKKSLKKKIAYSPFKFNEARIWLYKQDNKIENTSSKKT